MKKTDVVSVFLMIEMSVICILILTVGTVAIMEFVIPITQSRLKNLPVCILKDEISNPF